MSLREQLSGYNKDQLRQELGSPLVQWVGVAIALIVLWYMLLGPYFEWRGNKLAQLRNNIVQVEKLTALSKQRATQDERYQQLRGEFSDSRKLLLKSRSFNQALTEQVALVEEAFRPLGLNFGSRRFGEPAFSPWLGEKVTSQWGFTGSSQQLLDLLYVLARQQPLLVPVNLELRLSRGERMDMTLGLASYRQLPLEDLRFQSQRSNP